ncbi:MAG: hypothetical protein HMLIMOIP_002619 [Candidatus Nitrosomirales archaeon]|jgi:hypothetical protein
MDLSEYYFDIETAPLEQYRAEIGASFDPCKSKIISIQYQELDNRTGHPTQELQILKEWLPESSEKAIVEQFKKMFIDRGIWQFIPVGNNLAFECRFMKYKLKQYCNLEGLKLGQRPMIDLKHVLVIANNGSFKGYARLLRKSGLALNITSWYYDKNWTMIEQYITKEASDFVKAYSVLKKEIPNIVLT